MGAGFNGRVQALHRATFGGVPSVFAGGAFTKSGNDPIGGIGRWAMATDAAAELAAGGETARTHG